jgi:hypothetical protein
MMLARAQYAAIVPISFLLVLWSSKRKPGIM